MVAFGRDSPAAQAHRDLREGRYPRAVAEIDQLLAAEPDNAVYRCWHSYALLGVDNAAEAVGAARKAVELDPKLVAGYVALAWAATRLGRRQEAQEALETALALSGREPAILVEYASFLATHRAPGVAEKVARQAVAALPHSADAWRALGWTLFRLHQHDEAQRCLDRALSLAPKDPETLICAIELLRHTGRHARAAALAQVLREDPHTAEIGEELHRQVAGKLLRASPRLQRFLPAVDADQQYQRAVVWHYGRKVLWGVGLAAFALGLADKLARSRLLPTGMGVGLTLLGILLIGFLWLTRDA
jgi:Tfp pilus assembly protein PilF